MSLLERFKPAQHAPLPQGAGVGLRWGALARQRRTSVGIDFGSGAMKVAQIRWTRQGPRLENYAVVPMGPGRLEEGTVKDPTAVGDLLRSTLAEMGITQSIVGTAVGGPNILMRYINLPKVPPEEMRAAMKFEAPQHLPIAEDQLVYDFTPVPEATGVPEHQTAVFLSGTHKKLIDSFMTTLNRAGLKPSVIELDCLAMLRSVQWIGLVSHTSQLPLVLLDFGETDTRVSIIRYGVPMLSRTIPTGLYHLRTAIADSMHIAAAEAEMALRLKGVKEDLDLSAAVEPWLNGLMENVGRSIEFFLIQNRGASLERVFLVGGGAMLPELPEALSRYLQGMLTGRPEAEHLRVQAVGLAGLDINPDLLPAVNNYGPLLMGAVGCALREGSPE
jgi:type IV pilus assembly protein PilM